MTTWKVTIYRADSETPVVYENVKHTWWEDNGARFVISQFSKAPKHHYFIWPVRFISHVRLEKSDG